MNAPDAPVSPDDRGLLYGDGVFETFLAVDGDLMDASRHIARLRRSAETLGIPLDPMQAVGAARACAAGCVGPHGVRVTVTRGRGAGLTPEGAGPPTLRAALYAVPYTAEDHARGIDVIVAETRRLPAVCVPSHVKSLNYLPNVLARREAAAAGARDALMRSVEGDVVESTVANLFLVEGGTLLTPPLSAGCFPGLTREDVLEAARADGIPVEERRIPPAGRASADEAFLTSTLAGILPIRTVDRTRVGKGVPGPVTRRLAMLSHGPSLDRIKNDPVV